MDLPQFFCYHCNKFSDANKSDIRLKVIGNLSAPDASFQLLLRSIGTITAENKNRFDPIAANHGGRLGCVVSRANLVCQQSPDRLISTLAGIVL